MQVVNVTRAVQADPDQETVRGKKFRPFIVDEDTVRLDGIGDDLVGSAVFFLYIHRLLEKIKPHEHRLASLPHVRNRLPFGILGLSYQRGKCFPCHTVRCRFGIVLRGLAIEAVIAEEVTVG